MPINTEKIFKEIDKGTLDEQYAVLSEIKAHIAENLEADQKAADELASKRQDQIGKINGN